VPPPLIEKGVDRLVVWRDGAEDGAQRRVDGRPDELVQLLPGGASLVTNGMAYLI